MLNHWLSKKTGNPDLLILGTNAPETAGVSAVTSLSTEQGGDDTPLCGISDITGINSLMSTGHGKMKQNN